MSLAGKKDVFAGFSNSEEWVQVVYDFAVDGGASLDYDVLEAEESIVITDFYAKVVTAVTSAGSCVIDLGVNDGGVELWSNKNVEDSSLAINTLHGKDTALTPAPLLVAKDAKIVMGVELGDITAGKINFNFKVRKFV